MKRNEHAVQAGEPGGRDAARGVYVTDLDRCQPASALSSNFGLHRWRVLGYETDSLHGNMLAAGEGTAAPHVTYPLQVQGWHAVYVGLYQDLYHGTSTVEVKLTGDPAFTVLDLLEGDKRIEEVFWKSADLTGRQIVFGQLGAQVTPVDLPGAFQCLKARVAYLRLVPLTDVEVSAIQADRQRRDTRRLFVHNDAHGPLYLYRTTSPEDIRREIEQYRATDFARLYWEAGGGDLINYLGKVGRIPTCDGQDDFERIGDRVHAECWRTFRDTGVDPFRIACDFAHAAGLEFHAGYRTAGFHYPPTIDQWNVGSFYDRHPELRAVARDGSQAPRLSYTFPETRQFVISLLREVAQYPIDGVALIYNRMPPLVEYEPPLVQGFQAEFGEDPRQLAENDPRWLTYRSRILTQFMRDLRQAMDQETQKQGRAKRIEISALVSNAEDCRTYGMDVRTWAKEGLVDTLIPYTSQPNLESYVDSWPDMADVAHWVSLTRGTVCKLALNIMPRNRTADEYRSKAAELYAAGVENMFFWDCWGSRARGWSTLRRLGHREEIEAWLQDGKPPFAPLTMQVHKLGDYGMAYGTPG